MHCIAYYLIQPIEGGSFPDGYWQQCSEEVARLRPVHVSEQVALMVPLCSAHAELLEIRLEEVTT